MLLPARSTTGPAIPRATPHPGIHTHRRLHTATVLFSLTAPSPAFPRQPMGVLFMFIHTVPAIIPAMLQSQDVHSPHVALLEVMVEQSTVRESALLPSETVVLVHATHPTQHLPLEVAARLFKRYNLRWQFRTVVLIHASPENMAEVCFSMTPALDLPVPWLSVSSINAPSKLTVALVVEAYLPPQPLPLI